MSDYEGVSKYNSRGSERESSRRDRERDRGQDREKDGDRYTREYKDRSGRFDRGRNSYDGYLRGRNQDFDRTTVRYSPDDAWSGTKFITFWGIAYGSSIDASSSQDSAGYKACMSGIRWSASSLG